MAPSPSPPPQQVPRTALAEEEGVSRSLHKTAPPLAPAATSPSARYITLGTFASAGLANVLSATLTNGFDVIKLRQQLLLAKQRASFYSVARGMLARDGVLSLWSGVTASCLREATYSTIRMGGYEPCKRLYSSTLGVADASSFTTKLLAGISSGALGAFLSSPTDLLKVRMQASRDARGGKPPYRTTFHGFAEVYRKEGGMKGLWRGVAPNTVRAAVLTSSQIATYDEVKGWLKGKTGVQEGFKLHLGASMVAGFVCSAASNPVDVIKVRIMNVAAATSSASALSLLGTLLRNEGPLALWKGFGMCWARLGTHTVISLVLFESFREAMGIKPL